MDLRDFGPLRQVNCSTHRRFEAGQWITPFLVQLRIVSRLFRDEKFFYGAPISRSLFPFITLPRLAGLHLALMEIYFFRRRTMEKCASGLRFQESRWVRRS